MDSTGSMKLQHAQISTFFHKSPVCSVWAVLRYLYWTVPLNSHSTVRNSFVQAVQTAPYSMLNTSEQVPLDEFPLLLQSRACGFARTQTVHNRRNHSRRTISFDSKRLWDGLTDVDFLTPEGIVRISGFNFQSNAIPIQQMAQTLVNRTVESNRHGIEHLMGRKQAGAAQCIVVRVSTRRDEL